MLYLIGGPPRCGKTTLAEALSRATSLPYFTLDHVTSAITPYIPDEEHATKLPLGAARRETGFSNDLFYARYSAEQAVGFYLTVAETFWAGISNFIRYALDDEHDLILEGWQMLPRPLAATLTSADVGRVKVLFLCKTEVERITSGLKASTARIDWVIRNTKQEATFLAIARMVSHFSDYVIKDAEACGFRAVNTDLAFERTIAETLESLLA